MTKTENKALILIPCCEQKKVVQSQGFAQPLPNTLNMRTQLLQLIQQTPNLTMRQENQRGILNPNAPLTWAVNLYAGKFYRIAGVALNNLMAGCHPSIHVLIVSACYGLTKLNEGLKEYELQMGDILYNGMKVYQFWQRNQLWRILYDYIDQNSITYVWSLLPDSMPKFPYHQVFNNLWRVLRNTPIQCFHVKVPGAGTGTGQKRAQWLRAILNINPNHLVGEPFPPARLADIPNYIFDYNIC